MLISINNKIVKDQEAKIPISSSLLRGFGVFETMRTYENKKFFKPENHLQRLFDSAKKINLKVKYSKPQILRTIDKISKRSPHKIQRIKIIALENQLIITSEKEVIPKLNKGVKCMSVNCVRSLPEVKSVSYLPSYFSHEKAVAKGFYEAILVDDEEYIYEGAYTNIFWFEGDNLCTRKDKILPGIIRDTVVKISPYPVKFKTIKLKELITKEEVFLTNSIKGIVAVTQINKEKIKTDQKTKILADLLDTYIKKNSSSIS